MGFIKGILIGMGFVLGAVIMLYLLSFISDEIVRNICDRISNFFMELGE